VDVVLERRPVGVQQIELEFHAHLRGVPEPGQPGQHPFQCGTRVEQGRITVVRNDIRDDVANPRPPRQRPERREVRHREHVGIAAGPVGQPQPVDDGAIGVPAQRCLTERESVPFGPIEELPGGYSLALRMAERIAPRHLDLGE
jgi:hypothetical protein